MKTLRDQYKLILEGKGDKNFFLKQARIQFSNYFNQYTDFSTAVKVLKEKQILGVKKLIKEDIDPFIAFNQNLVKDQKKLNPNVWDLDQKKVENLNANEILKGFYAEMSDPKNVDKTVEELKQIVFANLIKDPLFYVKDGQFGLKGVGYVESKPTEDLKGKYGIEQKIPINETLNETLWPDKGQMFNQFYKEIKFSESKTELSKAIKKWNNNKSSFSDTQIKKVEDLIALINKDGFIYKESKLNLKESIKPGDKVIITKGQHKGKEGKVGEIAHGLHKKAAKTYIIDYDFDPNREGYPWKSIDLNKDEFKVVKEKESSLLEYFGLAETPDMDTVSPWSDEDYKGDKDFKYTLYYLEETGDAENGPGLDKDWIDSSDNKDDLIVTAKEEYMYHHNEMAEEGEEIEFDDVPLRKDGLPMGYVIEENPDSKEDKEANDWVDKQHGDLKEYFDTPEKVKAFMNEPSSKGMKEDNKHQDYVEQIIDVASHTDEDGLRILSLFILNDKLEDIDLEDGNEFNEVVERLQKALDESSLKEIQKIYDLLQDEGLVGELNEDLGKPYQNYDESDEDWDAKKEEIENLIQDNENLDELIAIGELMDNEEGFDYYEVGPLKDQMLDFLQGQMDNEAIAEMYESLKDEALLENFDSGIGGGAPSESKKDKIKKQIDLTAKYIPLVQSAYDGKITFKELGEKLLNSDLAEFYKKSGNFDYWKEYIEDSVSAEDEATYSQHSSQSFWSGFTDIDWIYEEAERAEEDPGELLFYAKKKFKNLNENKDRTFVVNDFSGLDVKLNGGSDTDEENSDTLALEPGSYVLTIDYPLNKPKQVKFKTSKDVTLGSLIDLIKKTYEKIYENESDNVYGHDLEQLILTDIYIDNNKISLEVDS